MSVTGKLRKKSSLRHLLLGVLCALVFLSFAEPALSAHVALFWDSNDETDLAGYCAYFSKNTPGPPFITFGCVTLQELNDLKNPKFVLTGLEHGATYCFAVTAYDRDGNESSYSNQVCAQAVNKALPWLPLLLFD